MFGQVGDGVGTAVEQNGDYRLVSGEHGFGQIVLGAEESEIVAVAFVLGSPGLAGGLLVVAQDEDDHVGFLGRLYGFRYARGVAVWIAEDYFVGVPVGKRFGDFRTFSVENFCGRADAMLDSLENADTAAGFIAVATEVNVGGVGADHRDVFVLGGVQREKVILIFQEDEGFARGLQRKFLVILVVGDCFGVGGIDIGIVEKSGQEFFAGMGCYGAIDRGFGDFALLHLVDQRGVGIREGELDVDAGVQCESRGGFLGADDVVNPDELGDAEIVGDEHAAKTPLMAKNVDQQVFVAVRRDAVDFVVRGHDTLDMGFFYGGFERFQPVFADDALGVVAGRHVGAAFGLAVDGEVFGGGQDVGLVDPRSRSLKALDGGNTDACN